eukprot:TRINITY_DN719_c0_g3_i1.p1 TRINITY_DN719_c0_g3~~TRINITY_DN719_c0_g3_i1.p1  ORF type:complete len:663 (+),score=163.27 TRINITY_DN719_c0_g3_i1:30-2018(+)
MASSQRFRAVRVKDKSPAAVQITAEQILREAWERQEAEPKPPRQKITDAEELAEYRMRKRKEYEDAIRRNRYGIGGWLKYAAWEEQQGDLERARSIFERAIEVDYRNVQIWLKYAETEMRNRNVNHARNVWDRAVTLLPRVNQFWYKYIFMEDMLSNYAGARRLYERWMEWKPDKHAWYAYIKFETRNNEIDRVRDIFRRFVMCHETVDAWLKWAKWEEGRGEVDSSRKVYEMSLEYLGEDSHHPKLFISFAKFEERYKEFDRARTIYKYALDHIPKNIAGKLFQKFIQFEKQFGNREGIEDVIFGKRRFQYEEEVKHNPMNYDAWFDYIRLEESTGDKNKIREVYERAIANKPPAEEKRFWRRYIYLWINYALYEELDAKDIERTRQVYKEALRLVPHAKFSFAKLWIMFANFELRQKDLTAVRATYGNAIGLAPSEKIFRAYILLETLLCNFDRCRTLYSKYLEWNPENCNAWVDFAKFEDNLGEIERARALFDLAIQQQLLDMPELVWKKFIDFEMENEENDKVRHLYEELLKRTKHVKVWISFAQFEVAIGNLARARDIYKEAFSKLKTPETKEERVLLWESWRNFEDENGDESSKTVVANNVPERIIKRRRIQTADGGEGPWEEYYDYIFPDERESLPHLGILKKAKEWKKKLQSVQ